MVLGCHPGDCHYRSGNFKAQKRFALFAGMLGQFGIEPDRFMLDWVAAGEGKRFAEVTTKMTEQVAKLGPLALTGFVGKEVTA
jgi:F420-non-reducing hydrogenase iron-sulfur subunit